MNSVRQSLYLKYRPRRFSELVGQEVVARTLRNAVSERRLGHAYLFTGVRGTGKTSAARILARAINCLNPDAGEPCLECAACQSVGEGRSLDVIEIDAATNRGIDEIRELRERAQFLPSELATKVYIIDEAHMLTTEAGNAFLKTLEEPPEHACFVLATTEPQRLSETVLSRCQRFDFRRIPVDAIAAHLAVICKAEDVATSEPVMNLVAAAAGGSLRDAESMLDRLLGLGDGILDIDTVRGALGMSDPEAVAGLAEYLVAGSAAEAWSRLREMEGYGVDPRQLLRSLGALARERYWRLLSDRGAPEGWLALMEACAHGAQQLRRADDPWMALEVLLLRVAAEVAAPRAALPAPPPAPAEVASGAPPTPLPGRPVAVRTPPDARNRDPAPVGSSPPGPVAAEAVNRQSPPPLPPAVTPPAGDPELDRRWRAVVDWAGQRHKPFQALILDARAVGETDGKLQVEVKYKWHFEQLSLAVNRSLIEEACSKAWGRSMAIEISLAESAKPAPAGGASRGGNALAAALKHFPGSTVRKVDFLDPR